ncbi:MAG: DNA topoisomerase [Candidatus Thermoplasmatota archaeon]|nr:DNA topoisomerase [Candidatus Thermoplasmatota archaeon]
MTIVIIAEKPSVANDLASVLDVNEKKDTHWQSENLIITWAVGHLLELKSPDEYNPDLKDWRKSLDSLPYVTESFDLKPKQYTKKQLNAILKILKDKSVTEVINACDAARDGELIFRSIIQYSGIDIPISRMWMQSMTDDALLKAYNDRKSGVEYQSLSDAAFARSHADWIIGMNGSRVANLRLPQNKREKTSNSLGRVQTPTLALVVDHELKILSYVPVPYWQLNATFSVDEATWTARWERKGHKDDPSNPEKKSHRIVDADEKSTVQKAISSGKTEVSETSRVKKEQAPMNFDLTSLQKKSISLWNWTSKRNDSVAQDLYDKFKIISYPRTDSRYLTDDMEVEVNKIIQSLSEQSEYSELANNISNNGLKNSKRNFNSGKVRDHFAIIPNGNAPPESLSGDHKKLYDLIVRNFLASWYSNAEWKVTKRIADVEGQIFVKEVEELDKPGWREVIPKKNNLPDGWGILPDNPCEASLVQYEFTEEMSKPPNRLTERSLLALMESAGRNIEDDEIADLMKDKGLGTPATRSSIIENLVEQRKYLRRSRNGSISVSSQGIRIIDILRRIPVEWITSPELTGQMEYSLQSVQNGDYPVEEYITQIVKQTTEMVENIREYDRNELYKSEPPIGDCPCCGAKVYENSMAYQCEKNISRDSGCSFVFWKDTSGRWFDRKTATRLLNERTLVDLHGFFRQSGDIYDATVELSDEGKVIPKGAGDTTSSSSDVELCACPICDSGSIRITDYNFTCDNEDCKFRGLKNEMGKRTISPEEAKTILTNGKSDLIEDFISKRNRPFSAYLVLQGNRVAFEFPPRQAPADAKKFEVTPGIVALCPKTNVEIVETEVYFQPENSGSECKIQISREMSSREITRDEAKMLIEKGQVGPFDDFISKRTGNTFTAILYLKKNQSVGYKFAKK